MDAVLLVESGTGPRRVQLAHYLDAERTERAAVEANAWIKSLRHAQVDGQPLYPLIHLIRTEDERRQYGDYISNQLETVGFTVDRQYKTRSEASPLWVQSNPAEGLWNLYTGGWITTAVSRDDGSNFSFFYTPRDYPIPLHQVYTPDPAFDEVALKLRNNDFTTMEERDELFKEIWGFVDSSTTRSVDRAVSRLRQKIEADPHRPEHLVTVRGLGYRLVDADA